MSISQDKQLQLAVARAQRLKAARDEAERLLEKKSRELYVANKELEAAGKSLEHDIEQATLELSISNQRLQKALNERSTFIGHMSHEVRTPLNAISGLSEILLGTDLNVTQLDYIDTINNAARSLATLLNDMLDITKIEAGRVDIKPIEINMQRLHQNIISMFSVEAKIKGLNLLLDFSDTVPETLLIDKGRYQQIVNNLISNAIKNTHQGTVRLCVRYDSDATGEGTLFVEVHDSGVGIAKDELSRIFNAYEQLGQPSTGAGLGLAICNQLSGLMNGKIECESELGQGSVFTLILPLEKPSNDTTVPLSCAINNKPFDDKSAELLQPNMLSILVAEDNPTNQKVIEAQLAELGQQADIVENGQEALDALQQKPYDLVLMDIQMPIMNGEQAIEIMRSANSSLAKQCCIALTASCHESQSNELVAKGFDQVLSKPLTISRLQEVLVSVDSARHISEPKLDSKGELEQGDNHEFDYSYLRSQFGDAYETIFKQVAPTFLEHTANEFNNLRSAVTDGKTSKIKSLSHSINGAVVNLGLIDLATQLKRIENQPSSQNISQWVSEVENHWLLVEMQIQNELSRLSS